MKMKPWAFVEVVGFFVVAVFFVFFFFNGGSEALLFLRDGNNQTQI